MQNQLTNGGEACRSLRRVRVIPTLLIDGRGRLVKTVKFGKRTYIGDPINAVKIFNTKEVDELILLDIDATNERRAPNYRLVEDIVGEAFMPVAYGGGISTLDHLTRLYRCGIEKVVLSSALAAGADLVAAASARFGAQAVVACLPVKKSFLGELAVRVKGASHSLPGQPKQIAAQVAGQGAGEIILYSIDRDGTFQGFDLETVRAVSAAVDVPVVACGGAATVVDFRAAVDAGASAVAAGSMFVYQSKTRGVLISYPNEGELFRELFSRVE